MSQIDNMIYRLYFRQAGFIEETMLSVKGQDYPGIEFIKDLFDLI